MYPTEWSPPRGAGVGCRGICLEEDRGGLVAGPPSQDGALLGAKHRGRLEASDCSQGAGDSVSKEGGRGARQPWAGSEPPPPARTREADTGCVQAHSVCPTRRPGHGGSRAGRSMVNRARLSYFKSGQEFPVSRSPDGLEIADQNCQIRPQPCVWGGS